MNKLPNMLKYSLFLAVLLLLSGGLLVGVNSVTAPRIDQIRQERIAAVLEKDFPFARYQDVSSRYASSSRLISNVYFAGDASGDLQAVIYQVVENGYGGPVVSLVAINSTDHTIINVVVVEISKETAGIGTRVIGHDFGIAGKNTNRFNFFRQADVIAGVTVTINAIGLGTNAAIEHYNTIKDQLSSVKVGE